MKLFIMKNEAGGSHIVNLVKTGSYWSVISLILQEPRNPIRQNIIDLRHFRGLALHSS